MPHYLTRKKNGPATRRRAWLRNGSGRETFRKTCLHTRLVLVRRSGMHHAEGRSTVRPHQHQCVLPLRYGGQGFLHVGSTLHRLAIDLHDHVAALQTGVVSGDSGLYLLDYRAVYIV